MATEKQYPSFENFPTIGRPNITYVAQDTGYKYIFNQGYRLVSGSAQQINNKRPNPNGTTDLTASNVGAYSTQQTNNLLNEKVPTTRTITINGDTKDLSENRDWTVGAAPAGSNKQVQFNDAGNFGADADFTYDKTTNTLTTDTFKGDTLQSDSSAGVKIKSNSGSDVALFGAGGGQNATFYDGVKLDAKTASEILATDASKNIQTLSTATYPSLTELSYLKGVTSPIQTQIDKEKTLDLWVGSSTTTNGTETILRTIPVSANDVANLDAVWISCQVSSTQTSGNITTRIRVGTSAVPTNITLETELINSGGTANASGAYSPINNYVTFSGGNIVSVLRGLLGFSAGVQMFSVASPPLNATWYIYITTTKAAAGTISLTSSIIKRERL